MSTMCVMWRHVIVLVGGFLLFVEKGTRMCTCMCTCMLCTVDEVGMFSSDSKTSHSERDVSRSTCMRCVSRSMILDDCAALQATSDRRSAPQFQFGSRFKDPKPSTTVPGPGKSLPRWHFCRFVACNLRHMMAVVLCCSRRRVWLHEAGLSGAKGPAEEGCAARHCCGVDPRILPLSFDPILIRYCSCFFCDRMYTSSPRIPATFEGVVRAERGGRAVEKL